METFLFLQCLFILIIAHVSPISQSPSISRNNSSEPEYMREWNAYNKMLKNDSNIEKINERKNNTQKIVVEKIKKPISVVIVEPIFPNIHRTFVRKVPSSSDATAIFIYEEEVIFVPKKISRDPRPENHDGMMQAANSSGAKPSVVSKSLNETLKNNGTHAPLNKTEVINNATLKNSGNYSKGYKNDSKDQKPAPTSGHSPIGKENPYLHKRNETSNLKPAADGNSTRKNITLGSNHDGNNLQGIKRIQGGNRWYSLRNYRPSQSGNSSGGKPSVVVKSLNETGKNNGTHQPFNKTVILDDKASKSLGNYSKGFKNDSKGHESPPKSGHPPSDEVNPYMYKRKDNYNSTLSGNSTQKNGATGGSNKGGKDVHEVERIPGGNRWYPVNTYKPSPDGNPRVGKPGVVLKSVNTTGMNNGTHAPSNKTAIVDNKSAKNDSKEHKTFPGSGHGPIDTTSRYPQKRNETSNQNPQKPAAAVGPKNQPHDTHENKSSHLVNSSNPIGGSKPSQSANSTGVKPSVIAKSPDTGTGKNNVTHHAPFNKTSVIVVDKASKGLGDSSKGPKNGPKGHELPKNSGHPPLAGDSPFMYKRDATSHPNPGGYSAQKTIGSDNKSDDIYEIKSDDNVPVIPELKDRYEGGSRSHTAPVYFAD